MVNIMTISVIVAIYNIAEYLDRCVTSIINQSYTDLQIILIDDGSTDSSGIIADKYAKEDSRIKVIHKENRGLVSARKTGLLVSGGEYICFVDGDDWIEHDTFESILESFKGERDVDVVLCGYKEDIYGTTLPRVNKMVPGMYDRQRLEKEIFPNLLSDGEFYNVNIQPFLWNKLIKRELAIKNMLSIDERIVIGEDVAAILPIFMSANMVIITKICKYHYCIRVTSMMRTNQGLDKEKEQLQILHQYLKSKEWMFNNGFRKSQLYRFTMNNILTRIYPLVAETSAGDSLWPFSKIENTDRLIIYGAGNFGRAVYAYVTEQTTMDVVLWVDQRFREYRDMKLPVESPEVISEYTGCKVIITILDMVTVKVITDFIIEKGFSKEQIRSVKISDNEISYVLKILQFE